MVERKRLDELLSVTEDEALELCAHHLKLASIYFMNMSEDLGQNLAEAKRIILRDNPDFEEDPAWVGAEAFLRASDKVHQAAADEDEHNYVLSLPSATAEPDETVKKYLEP